MSYLGQGAPRSGWRAGEEPAIAVLLGGEPFEEEIVMWWNFIGRSHEEIVEQREAWNGAGLATCRSGSGRSRTSTATGCWRRRCRTPGSSRADAPA